MPYAPCGSNRNKPNQPTNHVCFGIDVGIGSGGVAAGAALVLVAI
jgi:hypothetical protein